jgi:hypothetical protein
MKVLCNVRSEEQTISVPWEASDPDREVAINSIVDNGKACAVFEGRIAGAKAAMKPYAEELEKAQTKLVQGKRVKVPVMVYLWVEKRLVQVIRTDTHEVIEEREATTQEIEQPDLFTDTMEIEWGAKPEATVEE